MEGIHGPGSFRSRAPARCQIPAGARLVGGHVLGTSTEHVPEGKTVKNRVHFDLASTDLGAETERLQELGATIVRDVSENGKHWITMADPESNEFDLISI